MGEWGESTTAFISLLLRTDSCSLGRICAVSYVYFPQKAMISGATTSEILS